MRWPGKLRCGLRKDALLIERHAEAAHLRVAFFVCPIVKMSKQHAAYVERKRGPLGGRSGVVEASVSAPHWTS